MFTSLSPSSFSIKHEVGSFLPQFEAQKCVGFVGFKNELGLTPCKMQQVGLRAFVTLGAPGGHFLILIVCVLLESHKAEQ